MKGGPFGLSLPWPDLALSGSRDVSKKWTDQCEVCGLKKKGHCYCRAFFLKRKTRRLKMTTARSQTFVIFKTTARRRPFVDHLEQLLPTGLLYKKGNNSEKQNSLDRIRDVNFALLKIFFSTAFQIWLPILVFFGYEYPRNSTTKH